MTKPIMLTTAEVAKRKGTTVRQVQRLAQAGILPATRGKRNALLFKASDVQRAPVTLKGN